MASEIGELDYLAAGGNRHPSAADWAPGLLAFGSDNNIALWNPDDDDCRGITALLAGHTDVVNAVKIYEHANERFIVSGGADRTIRIWASVGNKAEPFQEIKCLVDHERSVNTIAVLPQCQILVTGAADATVKIWNLAELAAAPVQSIPLKPRYLPLDCALAELDDGVVLLAVAGTSSSIQLFVRSNPNEEFELQATLTGHEGWIRSLDFVQQTCAGVKSFLLASASQDKYIRLWRFQKDDENTAVPTNSSLDPITNPKSLSNKSRQVGNDGNKYDVTFEALLIGHEDWVYTAKWAPARHSQADPQLLSASADNSLAVWQADESSGVWVCQTRLGEVSSLKGSTTATGSTGGFWIGLWQPESEGVVSLGRTGSWRRWTYGLASKSWVQQVGISGHTREIQSLSWSRDGSYLLSTGSDQTTRMFSTWKRDGNRSWHEFARPQIHGYDLNCIESLHSNRFISGADEKLLRVFDKPKAVDNLMSNLSGVRSGVNGELPDAANIPVLGLSNKAVTTSDNDPDDDTMDGANKGPEAVKSRLHAHSSTLDLSHPPFEDHLARHTLWPEHEKLYGHGYEISAVAASHDGSLVATACKASAIDHAVIRLYECTKWREVKPPLAAHSLTVTSLAFSPDDRYLLSVGRDRQWALFERNKEDPTGFELVTSNSKGHSRMILDCAWAPLKAPQYAFATAGRDKAVKVWRLVGQQTENAASISADAAITALALQCEEHSVRLAYGTETGRIHAVHLSLDGLDIRSSFEIHRPLLPSKAINSLRWRPKADTEASRTTQLAAASDDASLRIYNIPT